MRSSFVWLSALLIASACKGKPKPRPAPAAEHVETAAGSQVKPPQEIILPQGTGAPPLKTSGDIDLATMTKLSEMKFPGFAVEVRRLEAGHLVLRQKTIEHPIIRAAIHIDPCNGGCWPMGDLPYWKQRGELLKKYLSDELKAAKDTVWEVGQTDIHGTPVMYTYQLGQVMGNEHSEFTHAYVLYYNDSINQIYVISEYKDDMVATKEDMAKAVPRIDLENTAKAFIDVYTQAW